MEVNEPMDIIRWQPSAEKASAFLVAIAVSMISSSGCRVGLNCSSPHHHGLVRPTRAAELEALASCPATSGLVDRLRGLSISGWTFLGLGAGSAGAALGLAESRREDSSRRASVYILGAASVAFLATSALLALSYSRKAEQAVRLFRETGCRMREGKILRTRGPFLSHER